MKMFHLFVFCLFDTLPKEKEIYTITLESSVYVCLYARVCIVLIYSGRDRGHLRSPDLVNTIYQDRNGHFSYLVNRVFKILGHLRSPEVTLPKTSKPLKNLYLKIAMLDTFHSLYICLVYY